MGRLGIWQLDRLAQRKAENATYLEQINSQPLYLTEADLPDQPDDLVDRLAIVEGEYDFSQELVLVQQNYLGKPGAHLVTPLLIAGDDAAVLVDRGWIPASIVETGDFSSYDEAGTRQVQGVIQQSQTLDRGRETEVDGPQKEWYRVDIGAIQKQMPYELLPIYLLESPPAEFQEDLPYRIQPEIDLSDGPHLGYAIQWFLFATILAVGYLRFVSTRTRSVAVSTK